jgi:cell division protein FtsB
MKNIRKYEIVSLSLVLFFSVFVLNAVYAQDSVTNVVSDIEPITEFAGENTKAVAETVDEIRNEADDTEEEVRNTLKSGIDKNIIKIRKTTEIPAYELQKAVDEDRLNLYENLDTTLKNVNINTVNTIENLSDQVETSISGIENALEEASGMEADFEEERRSIKNTLLRLQTTVNEKKAIIEQRDGDDIYEDTDGDGLSDYDEKYIYETDPNEPTTLNTENIDYTDPRDDKESYVTSAYKLEAVALVKQEGKDLIKFEGRALPNSFVTLYIYSTPIIVTVKTDSNGDWTYELDQELKDGEHQLYVATVNNSGKIIARSNPISFTKTAEAASIGIVGIDVETSKAGDFFRDNFILILLAILILVVVLSLMLAGKKKGVGEVVNELKDEVKEDSQAPKV